MFNDQQARLRRRVFGVSIGLRLLVWEQRAHGFALHHSRRLESAVVVAMTTEDHAS